MKKLVSAFAIACICCLCTSVSLAKTPVQTSLQLQVVQSQLKIVPSMVDSAQVTTDKAGRPTLSLTLNKAGGDLIAGLTHSALGKRMNVLIGKNLVSSPVVQSELGRSFQITGLTKQQADQLLTQLKPTGAKNARLQ